ncbi:MAG: class I SAM-dependent methyltransferase [Acidimicrobiia bacterium]|nr:class I SAM-dependent methyltransferase [Acidimicrobiia bacterium]
MSGATARRSGRQDSARPRPADDGADHEALNGVLEEARRLGFIGPSSIDEQLAHSRRFGRALHEGWTVEAPVVCDLGAGGGLPSLPIAVEYPRLQLVLVDASRRRTGFLVWATVELGLSARAEVWCGRAEDFGHDPARRHAFDAVVARAFGGPAMTLECAAPLLAADGRCLISEPPEGRRWPSEAVAALGLAQRPTLDGFARFDRVGEVPAMYPRPARHQQRTPLFDL